MNHSRSLFIENLLNMILLFPVGILLPIILDSRLRLSMVYLIGVIISAVIETSQLLFKRGLFEWDDMIHNGLGCMLGCLVVNAVMIECRRKRRRKHRRV